jgi:hypothetical protein
MRRWHRYPTLLLLPCLLAAGCASQRAASPSANPASATPSSASATISAHDGLVGVRWRLTQVRSPAGTVSIPASLGTWFESTSGYAVQGNNGCALFNGTGHRLVQGFTVSDVIIGGNGCAGGSATLNAAVDGFGHVLNGQDAQVSLSGTELRLTAGNYTLLFAAG